MPGHLWLYLAWACLLERFSSTACLIIKFTFWINLQVDFPTKSKANYAALCSSFKPQLCAAFGKEI
jgi:hypothetical protein